MHRDGEFDELGVTEDDFDRMAAKAEPVACDPPSEPPASPLGPFPPWWKFVLCMRCDMQAAYCLCDSPVVVAEKGAAEASHILTLHMVTTDPIRGQQLAEVCAAAGAVGASVEASTAGCTFVLGVDARVWSVESTDLVKGWAETLVVAAGADFGQVTSVTLVPQQMYWATRDATAAAALRTPVRFADRDWSVGPGEILTEWLDEHGQTPQQLAMGASLAPRYVAKLLTGGGRISSSRTAQCLARHTGVSEGFWLGTQRRHNELTGHLGVLRILVTGGRDWTRRRPVEDALARAIAGRDDVVIVHGAAFGVDGIAQAYADAHGYECEPYPARMFPSNRARNQHMVNLGADVCLAFAMAWKSGTGMCARMARKAGVEVLDYGVDTSPRAA